MGLYFIANGIVSLLCAAVLTVIVLHSKIHEGVVIKVGMILMILALFATGAHALTMSQSWMALWSTGFTLRLGLLIVAVGFVLRRRKRGSWAKAMTDWGAL